MSNTSNIILHVQLGAEDRARIDKLLDRLEELTGQMAGAVTVEPTKENTLEAKPVEDEPMPWGPEPEKPAEQPKPSINLDQIRQRVTLLRANGTPEQKEGAKNVVLEYANNITSLPEDKWPEIWDKLTALGLPV